MYVYIYKRRERKKERAQLYKIEENYFWQPCEVVR